MPPFLGDISYISFIFSGGYSIRPPPNETGVRFRGTRAPKRREPNFSGPPASTKMASAPELENSKIKPWNPHGLYTAPLQNHHSIEENSLGGSPLEMIVLFFLVVGMGKTSLYIL